MKHEVNHKRPLPERILDLTNDILIAKYVDRTKLNWHEVSRKYRLAKTSGFTKKSCFYIVNNSRSRDENAKLLLEHYQSARALDNAMSKARREQRQKMEEPNKAESIIITLKDGSFKDFIITTLEHFSDMVEISRPDSLPRLF